MNDWRNVFNFCTVLFPCLRDTEISRDTQNCGYILKSCWMRCLQWDLKGREWNSKHWICTKTLLLRKLKVVAFYRFWGERGEEGKRHEETLGRLNCKLAHSRKVFGNTELTTCWGHKCMLVSPKNPFSCRHLPLGACARLTAPPSLQGPVGSRTPGKQPRYCFFLNIWSFQTF